VLSIPFGRLVDAGFQRLIEVVIKRDLAGAETLQVVALNGSVDQMLSIA